MYYKHNYDVTFPPVNYTVKRGKYLPPILFSPLSSSLSAGESKTGLITMSQIITFSRRIHAGQNHLHVKKGKNSAREEGQK